MIKRMSKATIDKNSPFVFDVRTVIREGMTPEYKTNRGASPTRIGPAMIAIKEGDEVEVDAVLTPLGDAVMVDATLRAQLSGECVRCLTALRPDTELRVNVVFAAHDHLIQGESGDDEEEALPLVVDEHVDLLQAFLDEAGMNLPFNPVCPDGCAENDVPEPDGISGEEERIDARWAGLEKFL
ncbi:putative metal-binding protein [Corynebacterium kutscheri]|uniref:Putative metal-binding protein n=2 Tax=Corynebacterium kutscheri TaxID=35755 RepID=A0A0F6TDT0_9CORY|nr:putative metal-binding protein [Corynebacterium kutscheri]VEH09825.1 metal-binding, possibly nucleic acid-binding protein [Corynebacterium kutscheri]